MKTKIAFLIAFATLFTNCVIAQSNVYPATDNVGIGTAAPASKLYILTGYGNALTIRAYGTAANNTGQVQLKKLVANESNYAGLCATDTVAANLIFRLPTVYGTCGQLVNY